MENLNSRIIDLQKVFHQWQIFRRFFRAMINILKCKFLIDDT